MGLYQSLAGSVTVSCTSADLSSLFDEFGRFSVHCSDVKRLDELTVQITVTRGDYRKLVSIAKRRGCKVTIDNLRGLFWNIWTLWSRPVLILGLTLILIMGLFIPSRILFITVEGNEGIPERLILEAADRCGLGFWANRRELRSEQVKNKLLDEIPELKWAGVNTYGCQAVITVRERADSPEAEPVHSVRHIVARRDGIITSCVIVDGQGVCSVGQAVKEGDILISGYTDCGISIRACAAKGEIFAQTKRQLTAITPSVCRKRTGSVSQQHQYSLIIGKKRINFYKGSGISGGSCVKMYSEYVLTVPGGFQLPVILIKETITDQDLYDTQVDDPSVLLESFSVQYLKSQMAAGTVIRKMEFFSESDGVFRLTGEYGCVESIGIAQDEKIGDFNGKTDGTDRERRSGG